MAARARTMNEEGGGKLPGGQHTHHSPAQPLKAPPRDKAASLQSELLDFQFFLVLPHVLQ